MKTQRTIGLLAGLIVIASAALAQGPGNPLGGRETGLSKKPGGIMAMGMGSDEINKGLGAPNSGIKEARFSVASVSTIPLATESVWTYVLKVNIPYAWNGQGSWVADANRMGEVRVYRHIGCDRAGKAVIDVVRVVNPLGQGVEMGSAIRGATPNGGFLGGMEVLADDPSGMRPAIFASLANAATRSTQLLEQPGMPETRSKPSPMSRANLVTVRGTGNGYPVRVLGGGWDVNPVGALGPHVPAGISPLLWAGPSAPATGGKGGGNPTTQAGTVPGVDIIIKKCPCGSLAAGSVGVVTNVSWIAVGAFDERKMRARATLSMEGRTGGRVGPALIR